MRPERGEDRFRSRTVRGATYFTSRQTHEKLTIVVKRFPMREPIDPDQDAFVMVHGIGVSSRYFQPLASELARRGQVYLVDLPGYGAAPNPRRDVTTADHAAVLASFLRRADLGRVVLVGHSWGSQVVSLLVRDHPEISDRIVVMAPTLEPDIRTLPSAARELLRDAFREPPVVFGIALTDYFLRCGLPYLARQLPHMMEDAIEDRIGHLGGRVLVIAGDRDPIAPTKWAAELSRLGPNVEFREVEGPHVIMHTDPTTIAKHIATFARP